MTREFIFKFVNALYIENQNRTVFQPEVLGELIRCKDCTHWSRESICEGFCSEDHMRHDDDFYCGYAERKEGADG